MFIIPLASYLGFYHSTTRPTVNRMGFSPGYIPFINKCSERRSSTAEREESTWAGRVRVSVVIFSHQEAIIKVSFDKFVCAHNALTETSGWFTLNRYLARLFASTVNQTFAPFFSSLSTAKQLLSPRCSSFSPCTASSVSVIDTISSTEKTDVPASWTAGKPDDEAEAEPTTLPHESYRSWCCWSPRAQKEVSVAIPATASLLGEEA